MDKEDLLDALQAINPADLNYSEWVEIGMALNHEGLSWQDWDNWSAKDIDRYHAGECERKWRSFEGTMKPVTGGTLIEYARRNGWKYDGDEAMGWDDAIMPSKSPIVDTAWLETEDIEEPKDADWHPAEQVKTYLKTLFKPDDYISYVADSYYNEKQNKFIPGGKGVYTRTTQDIIRDLDKYGDALDKTIGSYNQSAGVWVRFNPLDGQGVKNNNVTEYRYALVESDALSLGKQYAIIKKLELPVAVLVSSGGKSLHAIVDVSAKNFTEYQERVEYLFDVCDKNGLKPDKQNKNASRLSRLPGVIRGDHKQFIVATGIGKDSYEEWKEWYEGQNDDLPDFENLEDIWDNRPPLAEPLIENILRQGHKMLISGASKAGKSFNLIELTIAIAEGRKWLGWQCEQGSVIYINFELDKASCFSRFEAVYKALGIDHPNYRNVNVWNLRGFATGMDKLTPSLVRRAKKINPIAIIFDPIYKIITGDENAANEMAKFCNEFDKVCTQVGCSTIYCHHHSKGSQGAKKSIDRASGSGVFARDPDAILDLIELPLKYNARVELLNFDMVQAITNFMNKYQKDWDLGCECKEAYSSLLDWCKSEVLGDDEDAKEELDEILDKVKIASEHKTAWRVSCTLREFMKPEDKDIWFDYPIHYLDYTGKLKYINPDVAVSGKSFSQNMVSDGSHKAEKADRERQDIVDAYTVIVAEKGDVKISDFVERSIEIFGKEITRTPIRKKIIKTGLFEIENGFIRPIDESLVPQAKETYLFDGI